MQFRQFFSPAAVALTLSFSTAVSAIATPRQVLSACELLTQEIGVSTSYINDIPVKALLPTPSTLTCEKQNVVGTELEINLVHFHWAIMVFNDDGRPIANQVMQTRVVDCANNLVTVMGTWFDAMIAKHPDSERADDQHNNQLLASYLAGGNNPYTVSEVFRLMITYIAPATATTIAADVTVLTGINGKIRQARDTYKPATTTTTTPKREVKRNRAARRAIRA